jgi:hypothetical protein
MLSSPVLPLGLATTTPDAGGYRSPLPFFVGGMGNAPGEDSGYITPFPFFLGFLAVDDGTVTGTGALSAQSATMAGTAAREIYDLGTYDELICDAATMSGTGTVSSTGISTGTMAAQSATMSGSGTVIGGWSQQSPASGSWTKQTPASGGWTRQ